MIRYIKYSEHLRYRLRIRGIPYNLAKDIYNYSAEHYYDTITRYFIAVGRAKYKGEEREVAVIYKEDESESLAEIITTHPLKAGQRENRIKRGRWIKK